VTEFLKKRFTVKTGERSPADCDHSWQDPRGRCVLCGTIVPKLVIVR